MTIVELGMRVSVGLVVSVSLAAAGCASSSGGVKAASSDSVPAVQDRFAGAAHPQILSLDRRVAPRCPTDDRALRLMSERRLDDRVARLVAAQAVPPDLTLIALRYAVTGCDASPRMHNVLVSTIPGAPPIAQIGFPGETRTDAGYQDAYRRLTLPRVAEQIAPEGCPPSILAQFAIVDTAFDGPEAVEAYVSASGRADPPINEAWREVWTMDVCGVRRELLAVLGRDAMGGIGVAVSDLGRRVEAPQ